MHTDTMSAPPIRWGILGPGGIARRFAYEIPMYTQSTIVAVGSRDSTRAARFIEEALPASRTTKAYGSYEELVRDPNVEAVYVCTPHSEHYAHAMLALQAGKPILVEKAFTLNAAQAQTVFTTAASKNLFAMEAMWSRFLPHYGVIKQIESSGELGKVTSMVGVHAQSLNLDPAYRMMNPYLGGGALLDLGIYPLSLFHWLWGMPEKVKATGELTQTGVDLRESITMWYQDRIAMAYADMAEAGKSSLQIMGTRGRLEVHDWFYTPQDLVLTSAEGNSRVISTRVEGGFQYQAAEVARCLASGLKESPVMPWVHTVQVLQICDEVRRQLGVVYPNETQ